MNIPGSKQIPTPWLSHAAQWLTPKLLAKLALTAWKTRGQSLLWQKNIMPNKKKQVENNDITQTKTKLDLITYK